MSSNPVASPTRASTPWSNSVRVPASPTHRPSDLQPTGASSPKYEQASSASPSARSPSNGHVYARPGVLSVPDPLPKLGSPYQGAPARNRRRMPGDLAEEGEEEEGESADEGLRETEDDEEDGEPGAHSPAYALDNMALMSLSKPSPLPRLPQGPDRFDLAMAKRYSGRLGATGREDGSSSEQPQASSVAIRRHPGTARAPSASTLLVNTQMAQGQPAHASTPIVSAHTTGRSATSKRLLPTVPPSPISIALSATPTATSVSGVPSTPTTAPVRTSHAITSASPVVGLDSSLGSSAGSLTDGGTDMCSTLGMSSGGFNLTSSTTGMLSSSTSSLDEAKSQGSAFKTTTVLDPDKIQGEQAEGAGGGKGVPPTSPAASIMGTPRSTSISTAQTVTATTAGPVDRVKKATSQGHLLSQTGRSASSRVKSPPSVDTQAGEDRRATSRSGSTTSLFAAARSPKTLALTSRNALMHLTQRSILEDSEETGAEEAAEGEADSTGPEATAERQRLWLCIVSTLFNQQLLVCLLHKQGRQLESHCFLGMNILRSQWLHQLQVERQHSMQQKMATCLKAIKLFRRYKGRMARRRFFSQMVLLRSFFNGPVYNYFIAPQTRAVKILTVFLQEILEDKFLRRKLMRRLLYNIHKCQRYTRQYLACTAARMAGLRNYWDRVEATYHVKVRELIDLAAQVESDAIRMQLPSPLSSGDINTILPLLVAAMSPKSTPASPSSAATGTAKARAPLSITVQAPGAPTSPRGTQAVTRHNSSNTPRSPPSATPPINTEVGPTFTSGRPPSTPTATQRPSPTPSAAASAQRTQRNSSASFNNGPHHNFGNSPRNNLGNSTTPRLSPDGLAPQTPITAPPASEQSALKQEPPPRLSIAGSGSKKALLSKEPPSPMSVASVSSPRGQPGASGVASSPLPTYSSMGTRIRVNPDIVAQLMPLGADCAIRDKQFALHMVRVHQQTALDKLAAFTVEPSIRDGVLSAYLSRRRSLYRGSLSKIVHERLANKGQELMRVDTQLTLQDAYDFIQGRISERVGQALTSPLTRKSQRVVVPVFRLFSSMSDQDMLTLVKEGIAIQHARAPKHSVPLSSEQSTPQRVP